tara:strand:+ start:499 stop:1155 length:657 start_codon:yes stop_codon:yes gene_type:complete
MLSKSVENYLKAIFSIIKNDNETISTNDIAKKLDTKPSSVTDMIKKLTHKKLVTYKKYKGIKLTKKGDEIAKKIVRKHRLWETFLVEKLKFNWDEVHEIAEQLEHIKSEKLTKSLDKYLSYPKFDPHGDPIPDDKGRFPKSNTIQLNILKKGEQGLVMGVLQDNPTFLQFLEKINIKIGKLIKINEIVEFDKSLEIKIDDTKYYISLEVAKNILIRKN